MTPVFQSKLYAEDGIHNGNCFAACLASLLDLPLWMVPPFEDMFGRSGGTWQWRAEEWLERMFRRELVTVSGHPVGALPEYYMANGPSPRGVKHSVIYRAGRLAHDPHPSRAGVLEVEFVWYLRTLEPR